MAKAELPDDWDWVQAREACNPNAMLSTLRRLAERDVGRRNEQLGKKAFQVQDFEDAFSVSQSGNDPFRQAVTVRLRYNGEFEIHKAAANKSEIILTARAELTPAEECRLKVGDELVAPWQLLKRVLEPLLFHPNDLV